MSDELPPLPPDPPSAPAAPPEEDADAPPVGLRYVGPGHVPPVPARDLTVAEVRHWVRWAPLLRNLVDRGIYAATPATPSLPDPPSHIPSP